MNAAGIGGNVLKFEKRDEATAAMMQPNSIVQLGQINDLERTAASENRGGECENGVCVIAWKPRRPTAVA